jgi:hypothetical protein
MKKTLFLRTESGVVIVPRLENSSWLGRWAYDRWLKSYFKATVQKAAPKRWRTLSEKFETKLLIEEKGIFREESEE